MAPSTKQPRSGSWKPLAAIGLASLGLATLSATPASALSTYGLDNTNDQKFNTTSVVNLNSTNSSRHMFSADRRYMRTFKMGASDGYLKDMTLGLYTTLANSALTFNIYEVGATTPFAPVSASLASQTVTVPTLSGTGTGQWFTPTSLGSLSNFMFKAGKSYGISLNTTGTGTTGPIGIAACATNASGNCSSPAPAWVTTGGIAIPIVANGATLALTTNSGSSWIAASSAQQSAFMEFNFTAVPAPALMGFSSFSGLMVYSRRLRSRIKASVA